MNPQPSGASDAHIIFTLVIGAIAWAIPGLALTAFGMLGILALLFVHYIFARPMIVICIGALAVACLGLHHYCGSGANIYWQLGLDYLQVWSTPKTSATMLGIWLSPSKDIFDKIAFAWVGITVGAVVLLLREDRNNSKLAVLGGRRSKRSRAPAALFLAWLAAKHVADMGERILFGTEFSSGRWAYLTYNQLTHHLIVIGTTGRGKTQTVLNIVEAAILAGFPLVYLDGKGDQELVARVRAFAKLHNRKFYLFDPTNLPASCAYNPVATGTYTQRADRVIAMRDVYSEAHYRILNEGFMITVFKIMEYSGIPVDLVTTERHCSTEQLLATLYRKSGRTVASEALRTEILKQREAESEGISSLRAEIRNLCISDFGILFDTQRAEREGREVLSLSRARAEGAIVFFALPGLQYPMAAARAGRMILNDIKGTLPESRNLWPLLFDEYSVFGGGPQILNLLSMGRVFGAAGVLISQSCFDLATDSSNSANSIQQALASVNSMILHQLNAADDAELVARTVGTATELEHTAQAIGEKPTGASSIRQVREFRLHPDSLKSLGTGEALYVDRTSNTVQHVLVRQSKI
jgi:hypothetical protein